MRFVLALSVIWFGLVWLTAATVLSVSSSSVGQVRQAVGCLRAS